MSDINYERKYLKYKTKYENLVRKMRGGAVVAQPGVPPLPAPSPQQTTNPRPPPTPIQNCNGTVRSANDPVNNGQSYIFKNGIWCEQVTSYEYQPILDPEIICALTSFRNAGWTGTYSKGGASYEIDKGLIYRVASAAQGGVTVSQGKNPVFYTSLHQRQGIANR